MSVRVPVLGVLVITAIAGAGCLPHVAVPSGAWPHGSRGGGTLTALAVAPSEREAGAPRVGLSAEGLMPLSRHAEPGAKTVWLFRATALPTVWALGTSLVPTLDLRLGLRQLLFQSGPLAISGELGGMPSLWAFGLFLAGVDGYAAMHASLRLGPLELFGSAEAGAGALVGVTAIDPITQTATMFGGGGGVAIQADRCRIALFAAVTRNEQSLSAATSAPFTRLFVAPYAGLQISVDAAPAR